VLAALALLLGLLMLLHAKIPNQTKNLGSLVETCWSANACMTSAARALADLGTYPVHAGSQVHRSGVAVVSRDPLVG